jgi:chemotaxis response regulator CheB
VTTIVLVEHPSAMLRALRESLARQPDLRIVGGAATVERGVKLAARLSPDVIVLDAEIAHLNAPNAIASLRHHAPTSALIVISIEPDRLTSIAEADERVFAVGKVEGAGGLIGAIRRAASGPSG